MAELVITPASVLPGANAVKVTGVAGEVLTAGQVVYKKTSDSKIYKADANAVDTAAADVKGIALNGAAVDQPVTYQTGGTITIGAATVKGQIYVLGNTPGGIEAGWIAPVVGATLVIIGYAPDITTIILDIKNTTIRPTA